MVSTLVENLPALLCYYGKWVNTINERHLSFVCWLDMCWRWRQKVSNMKFGIHWQLGSWSSRYLIFKVYMVMYNSVGKFSNNVETI